MRFLSWHMAPWLAATALMWVAPSAGAQSLGCNGYLVDRGESRLSVLQKCGEPLDRQTICVPTFQLGGIIAPYRGAPSAYLTPQCVPMEEWTYDRGQGSFTGIVRLYNGTVESVRDGDRMR